MLEVKICGLSTREAVDVAVKAGARYVGFVFFPPSPRSLDPVLAASLTTPVPPSVIRVGLFVDADDDYLGDVLSRVPLDMVQFHGGEPPERVDEIKGRWGMPVMKALPVARSKDLAEVRRYQGVADRILFDARPPAGADRPGGNARSFDWALLKGRDLPLPWMLAGGIDSDNVAEAVRLSGATTVDVSSGVEDAPGVKNPEKIRAFLDVAATIGTKTA